MNKRYVLVAALIAPLLLALPAMAASNSNYVPLSAAAPTNTHLYSNKTYIARTDLAIMFNNTETITILRGNTLMKISNIRNITLTAGDVINVSKDTPAVLVPVHTITPMAGGVLIATLTLTHANPIQSVTVYSGGSFRITAQQAGDPYVRYIILTLDKAPKWGWWHHPISKASWILWASVACGQVEHTFTVPSGRHTIYVGISTFKGKWLVHLYGPPSAKTPPKPSTTPNPEPPGGNGGGVITPNAPPSSGSNGGTRLSASTGHHKWLIPAVIGVGIIVVIVAVVLTMHPHYHHRR